METEPAEWTPVEVNSKRVAGVDTRAGGLLKIECRLNRIPEREWTDLFTKLLTPGRWGTDLAIPALKGLIVRATVSDDHIEELVRRVGKAVAATNSSYRRDVLPRVRAAAQARDDAARREKERIEDAQRRLDSL